MTPKLTIIMPCYNTESKLLTLAIESTMRQTYKNMHLVIGDDASTNADSLEALQRAQEAHPDTLSVVRRQENGGTARAIDAALGVADDDTDYFAVAASDDFCHPTWQERRIQLFERLPPQVGIVYDNYMMLSEFVVDLNRWSPALGSDGKPIMRPQTHPISLRPYDYRTFVESNYIPGVSMWRASVYEKISKTFVFDGYDTECARHGEDYWHWLAITDYFDAFWLNCDPALTWTYRFSLKAKSSDRKGVNRARAFIQRKAKERRGLLT